MKVRTRFAPSPTGLLHPGVVRTALFAWLLARHNEGQFLLRIEDTDKAREVEGAIEHLEDSLKWLGLGWDEEPVRQSARLDVYKKYAAELVEKGLAYADPFTPEQIEEFRKKSASAKKPFLIRDYRPDRIPEWTDGQALRFRTPSLKSYEWQDAIRGKLSAGPEALDDFIILKSDGFPTYNFANVIDDHLMEITHVLRGEEFIASIPKYLALYEAFGWEPPVNATMPLVLGIEGGKKLSKRDGSLPLLEYRDQGYLPEAMNNFLVSLGWNDGTEQEIFSMDELIKKFELERVQKSPARFDIERLKWLNGAHIRQKPLDDLYPLSEKFWPDEAAEFDKDYKQKVLGLIQERLKFLAELPELTRFFFADLPIDASLISENKQLKNLGAVELKQLLGAARAKLEGSDFGLEDLADRLNELLKETGQKPAVLFSLIRIATTQAPASPGLADTLNLLGASRSLKRIDALLKTLD